ncbi:MAG: oxaloacetate decarboxylase [Gammaproteobacteria bacterium]|nr:oxaloacetate decarboxylase [Gammaproteobacteria bacterium]
MAPTGRLRQLLDTDGIIVAPGVFDGLSAHLVRRAGFDVAYASGGAIARSIGYPDLGLLGMKEVLSRLEQIVESAGIPVIADADTGYGNALSVWRTVREFQNAGVAGLHIEDQSFPKRCGHLEGKELIATHEMVQKVRAAREATTDKDFVIIARTDAIAVEGFERAIARAHAYADAGADMLFVEAPESEAQIRSIGQRLPQMKVINMFQGGKTPLVPLARLREYGYRLVIVPSDLQRAVLRAMSDVLEAIRRDGNSAAIADRLVEFHARDAVVEIDDYLERERRFK